MLKPRRHQCGLTLVELMVAAAIALIAMAAILSVYTATASHSSRLLQRMHLHQQLYSLVHLLGSDTRRSGYWSFDPGSQSPAGNPFQQGENLLRTGSVAGEAENSCILLAYDLDSDGRVGVGRCGDRRCPDGIDDDNVEQFGYRLSRGRVQARYAGRALDCNSGYWQALTDPDIEITRLGFEIRHRCFNLADDRRPCNSDEPRLQRRAVAIRVSARSRSREDIALELEQWIHIRNDRLIEGERP